MVMPCGTANLGQQEKNGHCAFEDLDHSILQQPLNLGINNIKQILKCVQSGTREVKDIILNECNIIYECKVCLNFFRSLANFMYHKRCYCKTHLCEDMLLFDNAEEKTVVVQPEAPEEIIEESSDKIVHPEIQECSVSMVRAEIPKDSITINDADVKENACKKAEVMQEVEKEKQAEKLSASPIKNVDADVNIMEIDNDDTLSQNNRNSTESSENSTKNVTVGTSKQEQSIPTIRVNPNPMVSRRTRDKNNRETFSAVVAKKTLEKSMSSVEPVLLKLIPKGSNKNQSYNAQGKKQHFSFITKKDGKLNKVKVKGLSNKETPFPTITLKAIDSSPHAVYQSTEKKSFVARVEKSDSSCDAPDKEKIIIVVAKKDIKNSTDATGSVEKSSIEQKQNKVTKMCKQTDFHMTRRKRLMNRNDCNVHELKCLVCKTQFMSLKTLFFHMMSLHSKKRQYYPCPFCKTLFVQIYGVTRHLMSIHKKTKEQISKLRETVKKKAVWRRVDDLAVNGENIVDTLKKEVKKKEEKKEAIIVEPKRIENKVTEEAPLKTCIKLNKKLVLHQCSKCQRVFGRKSSQVSHEKFCIMNAIKLEVHDQPQPLTSLPPISPPIISIMPVHPVKKSPPPITDLKISIRPKRGAEKQMHKDFVNSQTLKWRSANKVDTKNPVIPISKKSTGKNVEKRVMNIINSEDLSCLKCDKKFSSFSNLRRHAAIHVGWTRFKCKYCEYQAYNKSQCYVHVQKLHSVAVSELDKCVLSLVCNSKQSPTILSAKPPQSHKQNATMSVKYVSKTSTPPHKLKICKVKPSTSMSKSATLHKKVLNDSKREKSPRPSQVHKYTVPEYKKEISNYKSVTTNNPTTIILSKKIPNITVRATTPPLSSPAVSSTSAEKISPTRTSPRKTERLSIEENSLTSLVTRSGTYKKGSLIPMRLPLKPSAVEEDKKDAAQQSPEKMNVKRDRLISEWFPKKDIVGFTRRDSAPLIIGLVPASSTEAGVGMRIKSPMFSNDKSSS